jgi:hypothetical protein
MKDFSLANIPRAILQYSHGDVIPVFDIFAFLTNDKIKLPGNKTGAKNLRANVTELITGARSNFKNFGFALALLDFIEQDQPVPSESIFLARAKIYTDDLKATYALNKPEKQKEAPKPHPIADVISNLHLRPIAELNVLIAATAEAISVKKNSTCK